MHFEKQTYQDSNKEKLFYIIAGCNGSGKTTASYNILPHILDCKEFVNADEIAKGLSPFSPDAVALQAGRLMLNRITELLQNNRSFAVETTLATKSYQRTIQKAQQKGYEVILIFFWLQSIALAKQRVKLRVEEGGHFIPSDVIERRYQKGIKNLFEIYMPLCDEVSIYNNSFGKSCVIAKKLKNEPISIFNTEDYQAMKKGVIL